MAVSSSQTMLLAEDFLAFLNASPSPFHAVYNACHKLKDAGFQELKESDQWKIDPLGKYYVTRNKSSVIAFTVGGKWKPGNGFSMIAAHTDSPCFKVKPRSKLSDCGYLQLGVMTYGGGIWRTWFDRDLTLAGRLIVKSGNAMEQRLVHIKQPILHIPNLAIHLDRDSNDSFKHNRETHLRPIIATEHMESQLSCVETSEADSSNTSADHHNSLLSRLASEADVSISSILDMELYVVDTQPACIGGLHGEFVLGPRLDNLVGTYTALTALINACNSGDTSSSLSDDTNIRMAACFDNEECGSQSAQGAESSITEWILRRLSASSENITAFEQAIPKSLLISADQAHAVHPCYSSKYEDQHRPQFHKGVVVKINANQRYATTSITHAMLKEIASSADVPLQPFVVRNDSTCGSTVGPILSAKLGLPTIDVGTAQLAMHSIREMADVSGICHAAKLYEAFYRTYPDIYKKFQL